MLTSKPNISWNWRLKRLLPKFNVSYGHQQKLAKIKLWLQAKDKKFLCQLAKDKKYLEKLVSQMNEQKDSQSTVQGNIQKEVKNYPQTKLI